MIPDSVTSIGDYAFSGCTSLPVIDDIRYADTCLVEVTNKALTTYNIKEGTKFISGSTFYGCRGLTSLVIPDSVTSIGNSAFRGCSHLTSVTIGNSVTSIGEYTFDDCSQLILIVIPDSVTSIGKSLFSNCSKLTSVTIGNSVTSISDSAFKGCSTLTSIKCLAPTAPTISYSAFMEVKSNGVLYYPSGSDYSSWMKTGSYYLGYYNWTSQEI